MQRANLELILKAAKAKPYFSVNDLVQGGLSQWKARLALSSLRSLGYLYKGGANPNSNHQVMYQLRHVDVLEKHSKSTASKIDLPLMEPEKLPKISPLAPSKETYVPPKAAVMRPGSTDAFKIPSRGIG